MRQNKKNFFLMLLILNIGFTISAQNNKYIIIIKQNSKAFEKADFNSKSVKDLSKGTILNVIGREVDFLKTPEGYVHRNGVEIREDKNARINTQIDILSSTYKQKLQEKSKEGLNLNSKPRDFIELPSRDTIKFENLKF